jgi:large subunit ribosomal protein LP1
MAFEELSEDQRQELLVTYAALVLHDGKVELTEDNLEKVVSAANGTVQPFWFKLFSQLLHGKDLGELLLSSGSAGGAAPPAGGAAPAAAAGAAAAAKEEEEEPEEEDADLGFSLFE